MDYELSNLYNCNNVLIKCGHLISDITTNSFKPTIYKISCNYKYIVNGVYTLHPNKLTIIDKDGSNSHYIIFDLDGNINYNWFEQSLRMGDPDALFIYGMRLSRASHIPQALRVFETAARNGHKDAIFEATRHIFDDNKLIYYYEIGVTKGSSRAMCLMSNIYISKDINKRLMYLLMAAEYGETNALYALFEYYKYIGNKQAQDLINRYILCYHYDEY